ncbi:hypothetical protein PUNSTDRAFT_121615 [Punctularia strigosozonata HHB-11173 SS5]|uniref:uncharacterized protein n=1 Tax=Punctularia strigosozonata (strain HHB-11173) TaxID=741275 RepID=UPI0004416AD3|nr:uncharacterized protein PUNSTDRAFT_121615 [Punctularia strigosozonata HHB-11173 SS5]EIN06368.1 hypothetical protein PUNSTDRAFT_121615 [Punctularia strigosozonata HHB-11173 SS5]
MASPSDLQSWAQNQLAAVYNAASDEDFDAAVERTFSQDAQIEIDGKAYGLSEAKEAFGIQRKPGVSTKNDFAWEQEPKSLAATAEGGNADEVTGSILLTHHMKFRIRAAPAQTQTVINFHAKVSGEGSARRIVSLKESIEGRQVPIRFPQVHRHDET